MDKPAPTRLPTPVERYELVRRCVQDKDSSACSGLLGTGVTLGVKDDPALPKACLESQGISPRYADLSWAKAQGLPTACPTLFATPFPVVPYKRPDASAVPSTGKLPMAPIIGIGAMGVMLAYILFKDK